MIVGIDGGDVEVKWAHDDFLFDEPPGEDDDPCTPVLTLDQIKKWVKEEFICDCGRGLFGEPHLAWCKHHIYERLLAQVRKWQEETR